MTQSGYNSNRTKHMFLKSKVLNIFLLAPFREFDITTIFSFGIGLLMINKQFIVMQFGAGAELEHQASPFMHLRAERTVLELADRLRERAGRKTIITTSNVHCAGLKTH